MHARAKAKPEPTTGSIAWCLGQKWNSSMQIPHALAGSMLVLSLNTTLTCPSWIPGTKTGYRTQGKALIEKGRKNREMSRWQEERSWQEEIKHTRKKSGKAEISTRELFFSLSIFDQVTETKTRE